MAEISSGAKNENIAGKIYFRYFDSDIGIILSLIDPLSCGFAKIYLYSLFITKNSKQLPGESINHFKGRVLSKQFKQYASHLKIERKNNFVAEYKIFVNNFPSIVGNIQGLGKRYSAIKKELLDIFSSKQWEKLALKDKQRHRIFNFKRCLHSKPLKTALGHFPTKIIRH